MPKKHVLTGDLLKSPTFQALIRNNARISDEEHGLVLAAVTRAHDEITRLKELEELEGGSQTTYRQRQACEEFIQKYQALLHWMRRFPTETLADIFVWCTEDNTRVPWNISHVCRRWRDIALRTPQLWRKIPLTPMTPTTTVVEKRFIDFIARDYLLRSRTETIIFTWHPDYVLLNQLFSVLLQHIHRWGHVRLFIDQLQDESLQRRLAGLRGGLHSLYALTLIVLNGWSISLEVFKSAPRLRCLRVEDTRHAASPLETGWPWDQVTHMSAHVRSMKCLDLGLLASFTSLVYLKLRWIMWTESPSSEQRQVVFPACKYLHLDLDRPIFYMLNGGPASGPLRPMHFPILEDLSIHYSVYRQDGFVLKELEIFVQQHATQHLRSFNWYRGPHYQGPTFVDGVFAEGVLFARLGTLPVLRLTFPNRHLLEYILKNLRDNDFFLRNLRKFDVKLDAEDFKEDEIAWISALLFATTGASSRQLEEIRLQIPPSSSPVAISPWDLVLKLDGWEDRLRADWERQMGAEGEFDASPPVPVSKAGHLDTSKGFGNMAMQTARLRRSLIKFMHIHLVTTDPHWVPNSPSRRRKEEIIHRWIVMFHKESTNRRWTTAGEDSVVYIHPQSRLRQEEHRWVLGINDYEDAGYLDHGRVPLINPRWLEES